MLLSGRCTLLPLLVSAAMSGACTSEPATTPPPKAVSPDVWAVVNGQEIHRETVEKAYRRTVQPGQPIADEEALGAKLNLLDEAITQEILLASARELKIEPPDSEIDAAFNNAKKNMTDEAFNKELGARSLSAADMRDQLRRDLTAQKVIEREVTSKIAVTDQEIAQFFEANKAQFNLPEDAFHIAQIVVTAVKDQGLSNRTGDDAGTPEAAKAKVQMLMERLKSGAPFDQLAMDYSEDPQSAPRGGDVGLVPVSALRQAPPQLRDVVMKTQPGSVNVAGMEGGYTIVAVVAKQTAGQRDPSMPEVRDNITAALRGRREQLLRTAYLESARNKAAVVNYLAQRIVESSGKTPPTVAPAAPAK